MSDSATNVREINRLHGETVLRTRESRLGLRLAVESAWQAGRLLVEEKQRVRRAMGNGAWLPWLSKNFEGTPRTAQNYMRLAECTPDPASLETMSLRQSYLRLAISTEPKSQANRAPIAKLPAHVRLAHRLILALKPCARLHRASSNECNAYRQDLRQLYELLRPIFEVAPPASSLHTNRTTHLT